MSLPSRERPAVLCERGERLQRRERALSCLFPPKFPGIPFADNPGTDFQFCIFGSITYEGQTSRNMRSGTVLVERLYPTLSEHDYGIKGLPGLVFAFSKSNPGHLCNLWNRVQTGIGDAWSTFNKQLPSVRHQS